MRPFVIMSILCSLVTPHIAFVQETPTPSLPLEQSIRVPAHALQFDFPAGWLADANTTNRITIVQDPDDLLAATDNNPNTQAAGAVITLDLIALNAPLFTDLGDEARLEDFGVQLIDGLEVTVESQRESSVMARRAMTLLASDETGRYALITFWRQDAILSVFILSVPTQEDAIAWGNDWEHILANVRPIDALTLDAQVTSQFMGIGIQYPSLWTVVDLPDRFGLFELPIDAQTFESDSLGMVPFVGLIITATYQRIKDLQDLGHLSANPTLDDALALSQKIMPFRNLQVIEGQVMGEPAYIVSGNAGDDYAYGVLGFVKGDFYYILVSGRDQRTLEKFTPTFHAMMSRFTPPNPE